jgi:uncharacterized membrane protein YeaQ/YmgE (transglycosylase-associated protein family)
MDDIGAIISWLIIGAMSGSIVGRMLKGRKEGFGLLMNVILGCAGALVGWGLYALIKFDLGNSISITLNHLVYAMIGTVIVILGWKFSQRGKKKAD